LEEALVMDLEEGITLVNLIKSVEATLMELIKHISSKMEEMKEIMEIKKVGIYNLPMETTAISGLMSLNLEMHMGALKNSTSLGI
jgi:hypothetical protein